MQQRRMKKVHIGAGVAALLLCLLTAAAALADGYGVVYNTNSLNLRSGPASSTDFLGAYSRGTWVSIVDSANNFHRVKTPDGKIGYMSKNYLDTTGNSGSAQIAMVTNANGGRFLNFRAQPNSSSQVLGIFFTGTPLYVRSHANGWYCVEINGQTGYVSSEYVRVRTMPGSSIVATIKTPNNTKLNMRTGPGTGYGVVRQFRGDDYVMVLAKGNGWWRVAADGFTGFMSTDFLVDGLRSAQDIGGQGGGGTGSPYAAVNNPKSTQALNLRMFASASSQVLAKLYNGELLRVVAQGTEWCEVTVQNTGMTGFAMTQYLRLYNLPATPQKRVYHPQGSFVNLRVSPDMNAKVATRMSSGNQVTVMVPGGEWTKVRYNGVTGYVLSYFLQ